MTQRKIALQIAADHPAFAGHFPGMPIVPGVVLLDAVFAILADEYGEPVKQISQAKFLSRVNPGEVVELHFESTMPGMIRFHLHCAERTVATGLVRLGENL